MRSMVAPAPVSPLGRDGSLAPPAGRAGAWLIGALLALWAVSAAVKAYAQDDQLQTFDLRSDSDFQHPEALLKKFLSKHRVTKPNDFCLLGYRAADGTKMAWVLWRQGHQILLWEGQDDLDASRRRINLKTDVVPTDDDVHGSTYLVTRAWVDRLEQTCERDGIKLHLGAKTEPTSPSR